MLNRDIMRILFIYGEFIQNEKSLQNMNILYNNNKDKI